MTKEFRNRQGAFDFATVALAVLDIAIETKKKLRSMLQSFKTTLHSWNPAARKPHQLVLELDGLAQIPLFRVAC